MAHFLSALIPSRLFDNIEQQQQHHERRDFADEWREILAKHGIEPSD